MIKYITVILLSIMAGQPEDKRESGTKSYLALGDSYTIGESVKASESFPFQLQQKLNAEGMNVSSPKIIAKTGWTTGDLLQAIAREKPDNSYSFITLLIGVNNQYRGYPKEEYRKELKELLKISVELADHKKERVFVISIPDWGVTDYAKQNGFNPQTVAKEIDAFNAVNKEETLKMGINYIDITTGSRLAQSDKSLIATDGLHPSAKMYANWVNDVSTKIKNL
jgi:lysophospholipase L1-like esterase